MTNENEFMNEKKSLLVIAEDQNADADFPNQKRDSETIDARWSGDKIPDGASRSVVKDRLRGGQPLKSTVQSKKLLNLLSIGIILVDLNQKIIDGNHFFKEWVGDKNLVGKDFYKVLGESEIEGPDFCPLATVRKTGRRTMTSVEIGRQTFELYFSPNNDEKTGELLSCVVEMRDITELREVDDKLRKLLDIGMEMADLSSDELATMSPEDRRTLLGAKVEDGIRDILNYDVCEIRLLEESTGRLVPLLAFGMSPDAAARELFAASNHNGITGYVAHNKVSYYCEETIDHPLYIQGGINARCSVTVPLLWHDKVIGTCNVESSTPGAFNERDLYYLQIFTRDLSAAIHTLNLLNFEKEYAVLSSIDVIVGSVSSPIDQILQDTSVLMDEFIGQSPQTIAMLRKILESSRVIKDQIALVRKKMTSTGGDREQNIQSRPILNRRRILVVDRDMEILHSAHKILEQFNCVVETAPNALVALKMIRISHYDAVICEIKPDGGMSGYQFMLRLIDLFPNKPTVPLLLTTGFGYDSGHTVVKAKQKGLLGVLFKPFVRNQLLDKLEEVVNACGRRDEEGNLIPPKEIDGSETLLSSIPTGVFVPAAEESSELVKRQLEQTKSFCQTRGEGRFKKWMEQISKLKDEWNPSPENHDEKDQSNIDAT